MKKIITYLRYFADYLRNGEVVIIFSSIKYLINKRSHNSDRVIHTAIGAFFCRKNTNDFQFANYYYEWGVRKYLLHHISEYTVFIDGGAGIGDYCILLSRFNVRCIAFEPVLNNFEVLQKNLRLNNLKSKIEAFQIGLGDKNYKARFIFNPVNTGASHLAVEFETEGSIECIADIRTFDSLFSELKIDETDNILFKLDIEGMEAEAIRGARDFIRNHPNITFILEAKHTGEDTIKNMLSTIADFKFGKIDEFNIYAKK